MNILTLALSDEQLKNFDLKSECVDGAYHICHKLDDELLGDLQRWKNLMACTAIGMQRAFKKEGET